jgi:hypothetical protein
MLRRAYGAGPLHLLSTLAALAVAGYALTRILAGAQAGNVVLWLAGAVVVHDALAFWLYTALDRLAAGRVPRAAVNYVRVPAMLSGLAFVVFFPLILGLGRFERATTLTDDVYLGRWLALSGVAFVASALLYAVRARRS